MAAESKAEVLEVKESEVEAPAASATGTGADGASAAAAGASSGSGKTSMLIEEAEEDEIDTTGTAWKFSSIDAPFKFMGDRELLEKLKQWDVEPMVTFKRFRFDKRFDTLEADAFLLDFFNSPEVRDNFALRAGKTSTRAMAGAARTVGWKKLRTTALSMDFFDKLKGDIVYESGSIKKCLDDTFEGVTVSDCLREMLVNEESENEYVFTDAEKDEFLYHVLKRIAVGGPLCQFEDELEPYLNAAKALYKELVAVHKTASGTIEVGSTVLQVEKCDMDSDLWPEDNSHNYLYLSIDPRRRNVTVFYGAYVPFW